MGNLANKAASTELVAAAPQRGIKEVLRSQWPRIAAVMPAHMSAERLYQLSVSAINQTPGLAEATPSSLLSCVMKCSALGLEPSAVDGLGNAYILPYRNGKTGLTEAQFIIGYRGLIKLAYNSGHILAISVFPVFRGEVYELVQDEYGTKCHKVPDIENEHGPGDLLFVYASATTDGIDANGNNICIGEYMTKREIDAIRARSKASKFGPWATDYIAMAEKTAIRKLAKRLPLSVDVGNAIAADETTPDYSSVLSPIIADEPEPVMADEVVEEVDPDVGDE